MKLNILSDLHLGQEAMAAPRNDADLVILAGDIARPEPALSWAAGLGKPVLYVPGNHEFYGASIPATVARLKQLCAGTQVQVLDAEQAVIGGVRFLGATLWTDFLLFGEQEGRSRALEEALRFMRISAASAWTPGCCSASRRRRARCCSAATRPGWTSSTRVVCNPRGYAREGVNENARFDPDFVVEVG